MVDRNWESLQTCFCAHVGMDVDLEAEVIYPADHLNDQNPRVGAHRCSNILMCNQFSQDACIWAGTNSEVDPFKDG